MFFSPVSLEAAAQIIAKAETQSLGMPILAGDTWDSNVVLEAAKGTRPEHLRDHLLSGGRER